MPDFIGVSLVGPGPSNENRYTSCPQKQKVSFCGRSFSEGGPKFSYRMATNMAFCKSMPRRGYPFVEVDKEKEYCPVSGYPIHQAISEWGTVLT